MEHFVEFEDVCKYYQTGSVKIAAADHLNFYVDKGEFCIIVGPSGAGKTTLFRILNGSLRCDGGAILVNGVHFESADRRTRRAIQTTIGTIYQDFALVENATCRQNVLNACLPDMAFLPAVCGFFGKERVAEADALLDRVGLLQKAKSYPRELSGGQKQRVAIVRALCMHPEILLFDEVTAALDPEMVREVLDVMLDLAREGKTMIIVTHEMQFASAVANRVMFLDGGRIVEEAAPAEFFDRPKTERAQRFLRTFTFDAVK